MKVDRNIEQFDAADRPALKTPGYAYKAD